MTAAIRVLWAPCDRYDCHDLPLHEHVTTPFPPELVESRPFAATHTETRDIARFYVDWRAVAYELTTGHRPPPPEGQLTIHDIQEATCG